MTLRTKTDAGATLVFAILIVTTIALVVGVLLTQGQGSLKATVTVRSVADSSYSSDAAAQIAINNLRNGIGFETNANEKGFNNGNDGVGCFGTPNVGVGGSDGLAFDSNFYPNSGGRIMSAYVACAGESGTGQQGSPVIISKTNKPGQAIWTTGKKSSHGLNFGSSAGNGEVDVIHGKVFSANPITVKATVNVTGSGVSINDSVKCANAGGTIKVNSVTVSSCGNASGTDTNTPAPSNGLALPNVPSCPVVNNGPEILYPGVYTMTPDQAGTASQTQTITFSGGSSGTFTPSLTLGSQTLSAPQETTSVTNIALQADLRAAWGIPINVSGTVTGGFQIVFPAVLGDTPPVIALAYSLGSKKTAQSAITTHGTSGCSKSVGWYYLAPSSAVSTGYYYFSWSGTWTVSIPLVAGTISTKGDGTTAGGTSIAPSLSSTALPSSPGYCVNPIKDSAALGDEIVFGGASGIAFQGNSVGSVAQEFCASYSATAIPTMVYGLTSATSGVGFLSVPAQTCVYPCVTINASNGKKSVFYFDGFVYAPWAYLSLFANSVSQPFFNFGLITDSLDVGANPSTNCAGCAFINLPDDSPGYGTTTTIVDLTVYLCPGVKTGCTSGTGQPALSVRVQLYDSLGYPVAKKRGVNILSWSEQR